MKRFIDLGDQAYYFEEGELGHFAFYCTVKDKFEEFSDEQLWESEEAFTKDYILSGEDIEMLERYKELISDKFKHENKAN